MINKRNVHIISCSQDLKRKEYETLVFRITNRRGVETFFQCEIKNKGVILENCFYRLKPNLRIDYQVFVVKDFKDDVLQAYNEWRQK